MIRINLLPVDLRRGNRISPKVLAAAFASAIAVSGAVGWFGIVWFGDLGHAEQGLQEVEAKLAERETRVAYHDQLEANKADYATRVQTIQDIGRSRRLWSKFCDELIDVVNNNGDTERHLAWFGSITVKPDPQKGPTVTLPSSLQDDDSSRIANFHEDLEAAPFAPEVSFKSDPAWAVERDNSRVPQLSLNFPMTIQFHPSVAAASAAKAEAKAAAKTTAKTPAQTPAQTPANK